jgi:hypothetical protein
MGHPAESSSQEFSEEEGGALDCGQRLGANAPLAGEEEAFLEGSEQRGEHGDLFHHNAARWDPEQPRS